MNIITISGKAENGKDTAAAMLQELIAREGYKVLIIHFADYVKFVCSKYFGWDGNKDEAGRHTLQYVGTDIVRAADPNFWVDTVIRLLSVIGKQYDYILIPDTRFPNEVIKLRNSGFDTAALNVIRVAHISKLTPEQLKHPSETAMDRFEFDYILCSLEGISNLQKAVEGFWDQYKAWN